MSANDCRLDSSAEEKTLLVARGRELALQEPVAPHVAAEAAEQPEKPVHSLSCSHACHIDRC